MGQALYRKHRSKKLSEIVGQEHITTTLSNALKKGSISHAYLFTGPRGVGKTSIARILAHEVNGLPYDDVTHLDIIEIDAASNRRIDEIRDLREKVHIAPTSAKYKVYIIDEVHMLTREAFNALLKTLEEPPEHVIFILATTEVHKLPETIVSRTQRFSFKPIGTTHAVEHLKSIAKQEGIAIDDAALELIAAHGDGSFRDSISLLDQLRHVSDSITALDVERTLGRASESFIGQIIDALASSDSASLPVIFETMRTEGLSAPQLAKQLAHVLRRELQTGTPRLNPQRTLQLLRELLRVSASADSRLSLELALYDYLLSGDTIAVTPPASQPEPITNSRPVEPAAKKQMQPIPKRTKPTIPATTHIALGDTSWPQILDAVKKRHNTLYGITRMAAPEFSGNTLTLRFAFPFHQKRLNDPKNKQMLLEVITETTGQTVTIECVIDQTASVEPRANVVATPEKPNDEALETISSIFGGAELME